AWNSLAAQYVLAKNYDAAVEAGEKAVKYLPNLDKAHLNLGAAYRGKQQYGDAEHELRKALELNPNYADAFFNLGIMYLDAPPAKI
ncbi:tetratricopeptide repeat protein, partial [Streptococcus pyogenes]